MIKNISKILSKGSAKQRIILVATDIAEKNLGNSGLLSETELKELIDTFNTPAEIRLYNKFRRTEELIRNALHILYQYKNIYREYIARIEGYCITWEVYNEIKEIINDLLFKVEDKKLRGDIVKELVNKNLLFAKFTKDKTQEGFVNIDTGKPNIKEVEGGLEGLLAINKEKAVNTIMEFKTLLKAIKDAVEENDFQVKPYINLYETAEAEIKDLEPSLVKYSKKKFTKKMEILGIEHDAKLLKISEKYFVFPDYEEIEIDEAKYKKIRESLI